MNAWLIVLLVALGSTPGVARAQTDSSSDTAVKAAFLFNFAKFTEWPALEPAAQLVLCVVGDGRVASALADTVRGHRIGARALRVQEMRIDGPVGLCHVLFISTSETRSARRVLDSLETLPVLTVSDGRGFARSGGIVEFFIDSERMRFEVNIRAMDRAGVRLSSRVLGLAKIAEDDHAR
ncbi:MAG TPA: YfiR family protein [Candidatus Binatia bacterium]|nr:YfiR family protein [Candidatus Binatia bacterium]